MKRKSDKPACLAHDSYLPASRAGASLFAVITLAVILLGLSSCSGKKDSDKAETDAAFEDPKVQAVMKYAPPDAAGVIHVNLAEFRKEFAVAIENHKDALILSLFLKNVLKLNKKIDAQTIFLMMRDDVFKLLFVLRSGAKSAELLRSLYPSHQFEGDGNGRYKVKLKSTNLRLGGPREIIIDTGLCVILGSEADDVDDGIVLVGERTVLTEGFVAGLGKGKNETIRAMLKDVDTTMQAWCAVNFEGLAAPKAPQRIFGGLNLTVGGGRMTLLFSDEEAAKTITDTLGNVWTTRIPYYYTALFAEPAMVKRSGGELTVTLEEGKTGLDLFFASLARVEMLAKRAVSMANLQGIGKAIVIYSYDHDDAPPPSLNKLVKEQILPVNILESPVSGRKIKTDEKGIPAEPGDYVYITLPGTAPAELVYVYERPENYDGKGTVVLFKDMQVKWLDAKALKEALVRTQQWLAEQDK